jgi:hypothetical protein
MEASAGGLVTTNLLPENTPGADYTISTTAGTLMLVPQEQASPTVTITTAIYDGYGSNVPYARAGTLDPKDWEAGESTTYGFALNIKDGVRCWKFNYTGGGRTFVVPQDGLYKLEVWGASGSTLYASGQASTPGLGGYSCGSVNLEAGDVLYIHAGGDPRGIQGGYNGGGNVKNEGEYRGQGGGGASDIRIGGESLYHRLIVAGGGGGAGGVYHAGAGGGAEGVEGANQSTDGRGKGGTQIAGGAGGTGGYLGGNGTAGIFGSGGTAYNSGGGGGGGGWYGGGASGSGSMHIGSGGGGSGWVYTADTYSVWLGGNATDASQYEVQDKYYLTDAETVAGNVANGMPNHASPGSSMTGNRGHGHARITLLQPVP